MTVGIVDTTVIVHLFRRYSPALTWYQSLTNPLAVTPITWIEIMYGAGSKQKQVRCKALLSQFTMTYLSSVDQDWAMEQMENFRLSHGISSNDCLIASVSHRLNIPLFTHNLKDMTPLIGTLAIKPYV